MKDVHPWRWAVGAFLGLVLLVGVVLGPVWAVHTADRHAHTVGCLGRQDLWDTLDALIVKVDKTNPGVRATYEPLLGARPTC